MNSLYYQGLLYVASKVADVIREYCEYEFPDDPEKEDKLFETLINNPKLMGEAAELGGRISKKLPIDPSDLLKMLIVRIKKQR